MRDTDPFAGAPKVIPFELNGRAGVYRRGFFASSAANSRSPVASAGTPLIFPSNLRLEKLFPAMIIEHKTEIRA